VTKNIAEIRSLARSHSRTAVNVLVGIMRSKDATAAACVSAANAILDRGWGKATQPLESGDDGALEPIPRIELDTAVEKAVTTILVSFGVDDEDRKELRVDFQHLRRWRKSVEQAQSYIFKAVIIVIVTGFVGAVWLGVKATFGK
jgi:hypothetical protein